VKTTEIEKIKNHIENIPSVAAMYVPELILSVESLSDQLESARIYADLVAQERDSLTLYVQELIKAAAVFSDLLEAAQASHARVAKERDELILQADSLGEVKREAAKWVDHLEAKGGHFWDGVPGDLMDALERTPK
jgi:hypothetical protein